MLHTQSVIVRRVFLFRQVSFCTLWHMNSLGTNVQLTAVTVNICCWSRLSNCLLWLELGKHPCTVFIDLLISALKHFWIRNWSHIGTPSCCWCNLFKKKPKAQSFQIWLG